MYCLGIPTRLALTKKLTPIDFIMLGCVSVRSLIASSRQLPSDSVNTFATSRTWALWLSLTAILSPIFRILGRFATGSLLTYARA
ncbi:MAG: hypothetical protein BWY92_01348 [Firmicutes bacterium ADurb.BinA052]|nr:MAG: hypothetical protein BWY92_01348 [Firmicutes bacterium ADurb.BinA052]